MELGLKIREFRQSRHVTQTDLCEKIGLSRSFLNELEKGKKKPSAETLLRIAAFFNVTVSELIGETTSTLTIEQQELLHNAKSLTPDQLTQLNNFLKALK